MDGPYSADSVGYLGFTSFKAVYEEAQSSLFLSEASADPKHIAQNEDKSDILACRSPTIKQLCLIVLRRVPGPEDGQRLFPTSCTLQETWHHRAASFFLKGLYETWGGYLTPERDGAKLEKMARIVSLNTRGQIDEGVADPDCWLRQFTGPNLRWDALGMLFIYWLSPGGPLTLTPAEREPLALCIRLCREFVKCPTIWQGLLLYRRGYLESLYSNDAGFLVWKYSSETMATMTYQGLHADTLDEPYKPTLSSELRRRTCWAFFKLDKGIVSFTGRPPLITRHYVSTPLPLDLKDDYLFADRTTLEKAVANTLDSRGWNTEGGFYNSTIIRARAILAVIRDEVFEIALGSTLFSKSTSQILDLRHRAASFYDDLPPSLAWSAEDFKACSGDAEVLSYRLIIRLDYLQNLFIIDRLLLRRDQLHGQDLLGVSLEMVALTVDLWSRVDRYSKARRDFEWIVMCYGAPAGGVFPYDGHILFEDIPNRSHRCMELLRPATHNHHAAHPRYSRSSIVQNLSLLVGFLDWVGPSAPNSRLCAETKSTIQQVLDRALNADVPTHQVVEGFGWNSQAPFDSRHNFFDTFEWLRAELLTNQ